MPGLCLTRRRTQLDLLAEACESRERACVRYPGNPTGAATRLLALRPDGVLLEWPVGGVPPHELAETPVDVRFEHRGQAYVFRSTTRGRAWCHARQAQTEAWKLGLPLWVKELRARRRLRLPLAGQPVPAAFLRVADQRTAFRAQLCNVSAGGLSATTAPTGGAVRAGELYWARFELPGESRPFEFVVRIAHVRPGRGGLVFGCAYCAADDPALREGQFARIESYLHTRAPVAEAAGRVEGA